MVKRERLLLCLILTTFLAACGTPATPGPTLEPTQVLPTRVAIQPTSASTTPGNQPTAVQPTTPPTLAPTVAQPTAAPSQAPATPTRPAGIPATATRVTTVAATTAASSGSSGAAVLGDPARGKVIFNGQGTCFTCHDVSIGNTIVGPSMKGVATRAATRIQGMSAADYIHQHIVKPSVFTVPGFPAGVMPQNFAQVLTPQQINDLVAYLMTLK